jgi:saccharopine dehydrogenase-like NADP-dependent oxidoreductase
MPTSPSLAEPGLPTVLLVGGYGLVGAEVATLLRRRHPGLGLMLGGRRPEGGEALARGLGRAARVRIDVSSPDPLREALSLARPDLVVTVVNDPADRVLLAAVREGLAVVDITRWTARLHRALVALAGENLRAPVVLASGWMAGLASLVAAQAAQRVGGAERIYLDILYGMADRSGPDSIAYMDRLALPFEAMRDGVEVSVLPLTEGRVSGFAGGRRATTWRLDTPELSTLPASLGASTVETRIAFDSALATFALVAMQRIGLLALLQRPRFTGLRRALLHTSGPGAPAFFRVEAARARSTLRIDVADAKGQAHLTAVGALLSIERALALDGAPPLAARVHFPEHFDDTASMLATAASLGVEFSDA